MNRWSWRGAVVSLLTCKALQLPAAFRIQLSHLAGEVAESRVAVLLDERVHTRLGSQVSVLLARVDRPVQVRLALASAGDQTLRVEPPKDRHVGGVRTRLLRPPVERLHHLPDRNLSVPSPDVLHDLGLQLVEL